MIARFFGLSVFGDDDEVDGEAEALARACRKMSYKVITLQVYSHTTLIVAIHWIYVPVGSKWAQEQVLLAWDVMAAPVHNHHLHLHFLPENRNQSNIQQSRA